MRCFKALTILLILFSCSKLKFEKKSSLGALGEVACDNKSFCHMFVSNSTINMDFASGSDVLTELDNLCDGDVNNPRQNEGVFKALFTWAGDREACTTAHCSGGIAENLNWILLPDTEYRRPDNVVIGRTNDSAIFNFVGGGYSFDNPVKSGAGVTVITSMTTNWQTYRASCNNFTNNAGAPTPSYGMSNVLGAVLIYASFEFNCGSAHRIICVEQKL